MNLLCRSEILLTGLWIQVSFVPGIHCNNGIVHDLSMEDVLLLKDEQDPKCFTRTEKDFTCFFETADNRAYDFLYRSESQTTKTRCETSVQRGEDGTFLHICSFPASDVFLFVEIYLEVVERTTNTTLHARTVSVEDHLLLDPPFNVSLHPNGQVGQLQVSWHTKISQYQENNAKYRIRYSSRALGEKTKQAKQGDILYSLVPGEEVQVQVNVKCSSLSDGGHWSSWSHPVRAAVPQSADDISLICYTSDLQNVTCHWNGSRYSVEDEYKVFYKMGLSEPSGWTECTDCLTDGNFIDQCCFHGDELTKIKVKLISNPTPISRTFYTKEFTLNDSIKTSPPGHLRGALEKYKLCLEWEAPLPPLSTHLQYEVDYQIKGGGGWKMIKASDTDTCLEVPSDCQYSVKVRAKPTGPIYSGHWSDWSEVLTGDTPADLGVILMLCIPISMLITAVILISLFYMHLSKIKQYFWPPVPNLDKVLNGFLTEVNKQKWDPPLMAKQCFEETTSSVVEIMRDDEVSGLGKPSEESTELLSPEGSFSSGEQEDGSPGTEVFPDYVTLNKESVILCPQGNVYVCEQVREKGEPGVRDEFLQTCHCSCTDGPVCVPPCLSSDFLNHSYLPLAEPAATFNCTTPRCPLY